MKYRLLVFLIFVAASVSAQDAYNLKRCLDAGLERNFDIRLIRNEQQISDNNFTPGNAGYLPTVDLSAGSSGAVSDTKQKLIPSGESLESKGVNSTTTNAGINLNWTVFDGFKIQATYSRLKELQQMGELNTRLTIEDFVAQLSSEYFNYIRQIIRLKNLKYAVGLSRERLRIVEAQYTIGSMSRLDLQQARVDFNADSSSLIKQYEVLHTSRIQLNKMMALDEIDQPLIVADSVIYFNPLLEKSDLSASMMQSNTELLIAKKSSAISQLDYKIVKSRDYPYLRLNAGYGYTGNTYATGSYSRQDVMGFNYGLSLGFTVFDGFNRKRERRNARLQIENNALQYERLSLALDADFSKIWMAYQNNLDLLNLEKENLGTAKENYEIAIERYKLGALSGIELREAQNSLLGAEERLLEAQYNTKLCEISLMLISGEIGTYME